MIQIKSENLIYVNGSYYRATDATSEDHECSDCCFGVDSKVCRDLHICSMDDREDETEVSWTQCKENVVVYEDLIALQELRRSINKPDFKDIEVFKDGKLVEFTKEMFNASGFTGLLNTDLIEIFVGELEKNKKG